MKRFIRLKAMVLAEVLFALIICGIILALSVLIFKSDDISVTPHIFATIRNISQANDMILETCREEGLCQNAGSLPDNTVTYCRLLADNFMTAGDIDCEDGINNITPGNGGQTTRMNFVMSNGVAIGGFDGDGWSDDNDGTLAHIDIIMFINTPSHPMALGEDIFPLRIYQNGEVIPSFGGNNVAHNYDGNATNKYYEDSYFFAYNGILNRAADPNNLQANARETALIPNVYKVSFKEAICMINPDGITRYFANENCQGIERIDECIPDNNNADRSAFCTIEPVKPTGTGIFKIFGIQ